MSAACFVSQNNNGIGGHNEGKSVIDSSPKSSLNVIIIAVCSVVVLTCLIFGFQ